jgi:hypothetical protein
MGNSGKPSINRGVVLSSRTDDPHLNEEHRARQTLDGMIDQEEYEHSADLFNDTTFMLYWKVENETLHIAMEAVSDGWISIGFKPTRAMKDADQVFGWVDDNGTVTVIDCYSTGTYGPHPTDESLNGTYDVLAFGGMETDGITTIEFTRNLTAYDEYDNTLESNQEFKIIWAIGTTDNFHDIHDRVGSGTLNLSTELKIDEDPHGHEPPGGLEATLDGRITPDEYELEADLYGDGTYMIHWKVENEKLYMAMKAETTGWVAIGFEPTKAMKDADMIFGWVEGDGQVSIVDCYSTGFFGPHPEDEDLGGTFDVLEFGGSEDNGWTIIEFVKNLTGHDEYDNDLPAKGSFEIIWATGDEDEFHSYHERVGKGTLDLKTGEVTGGEVRPLWRIHAGFMVFGFVLMGTGIVIARFFKKKRWRLKAHKIITVLGAFCGMVGLIFGIVMVQISTGDHFRILHGIVGAVSVLTFVVTPLLGFFMFSIKGKGKQMRMAHMWLGRIDVLLLMIISMVLGFLAAFRIWE